MKSKFLRILALILTISSLLSMFTIFASADEATGSDGNTGEDNEETLRLLYNRSYEDGWDVLNGLELTDQGSTGSTTFDIDYEQTADFKYNYYWRLNLRSKDNDFLQADIGAFDSTIGAVFEFDVKSDDTGCNFHNVVTFGTKGQSSETRSDYEFLTVKDNKVYLMPQYTTETVGAAFELTNEWTRIQAVLDFSYVHEPINETDSEEEKERKEEVNSTTFRLFVYYGPANGSSEPILLNNSPFILEARSGKGLQIIRFQSTGNAKEEDYDTGICFDNMKIYEGANTIQNITPDMGYGSLVDPTKQKTIVIKTDGNSAGNSDDLNTALCMKVGVDYYYLGGTKSSILTSKTGEPCGAPVKINGEVMVPIHHIIDYTGCSVYIKPQGTSIDISTGLTASYLIMGSDVATIGGEEVKLNAAPGIIKDKNGREYVAMALSDVSKVFDGFYGDYDDMGFITISELPNMLEREQNLLAMVAIMKEFVFDYFTPEEIYEDVRVHTNGFQHPYILVNRYEDGTTDLDRMKKEYQSLNDRYEKGELTEDSTEYWTWVHYQRIVNSAESAYKKYAKPDANGSYDKFVGVQPDEYDDEGNNLRGTTSLDQNYLSSSGYDIGGRSDIMNRTQYLEAMAFGYALTGETKYLQLCYEIAIILGDWTHWGPGHFLNCADSSNDFAVYFDWTYNGYVELAEKGIRRVDSNGKDAGEYDVKVLAEILARQGVHEGYVSTTTKKSDHISPVVGAGGGYYSERTNNWAAVCVGGMTLASLSILGDVDEVYVDEATYILSDNFRSLVEMGLDIYAPDGSYVEGPGYWNYGTNNFFRMCAALDSATGGNYGLMDCWGMDTTCYYACHTEDNDSNYFPYHDGTIGSQDTSWFFYVASYFNDATLYDIRLNQINGNIKWATIYDMIYYPVGQAINPEEVTLDYYSDSIDLFATRSSWERGALFASMIGGANKVSHGQIDAGAFVYHNGGNVWIYDLGTENYNCTGFWPDATRYRYYVMKPEGNNTVAIVTDGKDVPYGQRLDAVPHAYNWSSNEYGAFVTYDMDNALGSNVNQWKRGMLLTNDRKTTVIQDEISFKSMQQVYWFAHYSTRYVDSVVISKDGRTAYMRQYVGKNEHGMEQYQTLRLTIVSDTSGLRFEEMDTYTFVHTKENADKEATYSPEDVLKLGPVAENDRKNYRKLAITSGLALGFEVAVVIELIDNSTVGQKTEIDVGYEFEYMDNWEPKADARGFDVEENAPSNKRGIPNVPIHVGQSMSNVEYMIAENSCFGRKIKDYYRSLTDAQYAVRLLGQDMPSGYEVQLAALKEHRAAYEAYRKSVADLQKSQTDFIDMLMGIA